MSNRTRTPDKLNPDGSTTIRVQRSCDGCGESVGDVSDAEMDAAMAGLPLPSVVDECGCKDPQLHAGYIIMGRNPVTLVPGEDWDGVIHTDLEAARHALVESRKSAWADRDWSLYQCVLVDELVA